MEGKQVSEVGRLERVHSWEWIVESSCGKRKRPKEEMFGVDKDLLEKEVADATLSTINLGLASGGETTATRNRHLKEVEMA